MDFFAPAVAKPCMQSISVSQSQALWGLMKHREKAEGRETFLENHQVFVLREGPCAPSSSSHACPSLLTSSCSDFNPAS